MNRIKLYECIEKVDKKNTKIYPTLHLTLLTDYSVILQCDFRELKIY